MEELRRRPLAAPHDRPRQVERRARDRAAGDDEDVADLHARLERLQLPLHLRDVLFGHPIAELLVVLGRRRQLGHQQVEILLHVVDRLAHVRLGRRGARQAERGGRLVDRAEGLRARVPLRHARAAEQPGVPTVARPGRDPGLSPLRHRAFPRAGWPIPRLPSPIEDAIAPARERGGPRLRPCGASPRRPCP